MNISITLPAMAPQPTGHPASLPSDPRLPTTTQKVAPPNAGDGSQDTQSRRQSFTGEQKTAPPSVMQIKIMEILEQQASEQGSAQAEDKECSRS